MHSGDEVNPLRNIVWLYLFIQSRPILVLELENKLSFTNPKPLNILYLVIEARIVILTVG